MDQFLKDHQLNKAEFGVTDESISVWISGSQDKNPSTILLFSCYLIQVLLLFYVEFDLSSGVGWGIYKLFMPSVYDWDWTEILTFPNNLPLTTTI